MKKANLVAVLFGTAIVAGGGFFLATRKKEEKTKALPAGATGVSTTPGAINVQYPPGVTDTALQSRVLTAVSSNNPQTMRAEAAKLRAEGHAEAANSLDAYAASFETNAVVVNGALQNVANVLAQPTAQVPQQPAQPSPPPVVLPPAAIPQPTVPTPAAPLPTAPATAQPMSVQLPGMTGPVTIPAETVQAAQAALPSLISTMQTPQASVPSVPTVTTGSPSWPGMGDPTKMAVATGMNLNLASSAKGKENKTLVKQFQTQESGGAGTVDGLYGPKSAMRLASQYGIIPATPLYWSSKTPVANQKADYAMFLSEMADQDPVRLEQWLAAAAAASK